VISSKIFKYNKMACPFLDPAMLARLPEAKKEEMKAMYHRMQKEQSDHLKIDIKDSDIDNMSPEQMMMGMGGGSSAMFEGCPVMGGSMNSGPSMQN
jgi:hypothetical protein